MLNLLLKYAEDQGLAPEAGFAAKTARWALVFDNTGKFLEVIELGQPGDRHNPGQTFAKAPEFSFSELKSGGEPKAHFLIESADVVALYMKDGLEEKAAAKVRAKHDYFANMLRLAAESVAALKPLATPLQDNVTLQAIAARLKQLKAKPTDKVTLAVYGANPMRPVQSDTWHEWWKAFRKKAGGHEDDEGSERSAQAGSARCLATGQLSSPTEVHDKIKGLSDVGGIAMGDALISFKQDSFCSYGFVQGANAAVSEEAMVSYRAALNHLIKHTGRKLAGAKVVHWFKTKIEPEDDPMPDIEESRPVQTLNAQHRARELLDAIRSGKRQDLAGNHFYAMTLSGAAGRVMVRDWMEGPFVRLVENVNAWFDDLSIAHRDGHGLAPSPKFMAVLGSLVRDLNDLPDPFVARMWRVAVNREPIPGKALTQAVLRARLDVIQGSVPNHARMGLMRAYHFRKEGGEKMSEYLNADHPHPAYHCGRLMAVLADVQYAALGDVGAGVIQRYYAAASTTPALVLGRLTRTSQFHIGKIESKGLARWHQDRIASIWARIKDEVPVTLTMEEQSIFALGYYQQMAAGRNRKPASDAADKNSDA